MLTNGDECGVAHAGLFTGHHGCRCKGMMYLAEVLSGDEWTVPVCLACAIAHPWPTSSPFRIQLHPDVTHLENVAQSFEHLLRQPKEQGPSAVREQGLDAAGLTETARFGLPDGSLDTGSALEPFDWSAAPAICPSIPQHKPEDLGDDQDPQQDPQDCWGTVPEELVSCQRDAPEAIRNTPSRSGWVAPQRVFSACPKGSRNLVSRGLCIIHAACLPFEGLLFSFQCKHRRSVIRTARSSRSFSSFTAVHLRNYGEQCC